MPYLFDDTGRLRSGWRVLAFVLIYSVAAFVYAMVAVSIIPTFYARMNDPLYLGTHSLILAAIGIATAYLCQRVFEKLPFSATGLGADQGWAVHFLAGCVTGALAIVIAIAVPVLFGNLSFSIADDLSGGASGAIAASFLVLAAAALFEEVVARGYIFQTLVRSGLTWLGILLTAVFFGAAHLGNPGATLFSTLNTILAGVLFCVAYLRTRDLWFPWAIHWMWNWVQGSVFGIEISGLKTLTPVSILRETDLGPDWMTGGNYGIEGSLFCTIALIVVTIAIWIFPKRDQAKPTPSGS